MAEEGTGKLSNSLKDIIGKLSERELDYYRDIDRIYGREIRFEYNDITSSWANAHTRNLKEMGYTDAEIAACTPGELAYFYALDERNLSPKSSLVADILEDLDIESKINGLPSSMEKCPSAVGAFDEYGPTTRSWQENLPNGGFMGGVEIASLKGDAGLAELGTPGVGSDGESIGPGGTGWGGYGATSWSDFCAGQGLSVTTGQAMELETVGSLRGDFDFSEGYESFAGGWSDDRDDEDGSTPNDPAGDTGGWGGAGYGGWSDGPGNEGSRSDGLSGDDLGRDGPESDTSGTGASGTGASETRGGGYGGWGGAGYGGGSGDGYGGDAGGGYGGSAASESSSGSGNEGSSEGSSGSEGGGYGGGGYGGGGSEGGGGYYAPIVLDLDGDGIELVDAEGGARYDTDGDGVRERLGWAGRDDGLLAIDLDGDGKIEGGKELSFAQHTAVEGDTDLEGLAAVFDSNKDGILDAQDADFAKFRVWQDRNGDGVSDAGEVKTLAEMGIRSIGLVSDHRAYTAAGNLVHGSATYTKDDGSSAAVGDVSFKIAPHHHDLDDDGADDPDDDAIFTAAARSTLNGRIPTRPPELGTSAATVALAAAFGIAAVEASNALAAAAHPDMGRSPTSETSLPFSPTGAVEATSIPIAVLAGTSAGDDLTVGVGGGGGGGAGSRFDGMAVIEATQGVAGRYLDHDPRPVEDVVVERHLVALGYGVGSGVGEDVDLNDRLNQLQKEIADPTWDLGDTEASAPALSVGDVAGVEDGWIDLKLDVGLTDTDGSEVLLPVRLSGLPVGSVLSSGVQVAPGVWEVWAGALGGLKVKPPGNDAHDFTVQVQATSLEQSTGATAVSVGSFVVEVAATVEATIGLTAATVAGVSGTSGSQLLIGGSGGETLLGGGGDDTVLGNGGNDVLSGDESDQTATAQLNLSAIISDPGDVQGFWVTVSGLPGGATVVPGIDLGNGTWRIGGDDLDHVSVNWPAGSGSLTLNAYATGFDIDPDTGDMPTKDGAAVSFTVLASDGIGDDTLVGGVGDDSLISGGGQDVLSGGANNDTYIIDSTGDVPVTAIIHNDAVNDAGETDILRLSSGLSPEDVWFMKQGSDLIVKLLDGSDGTVTIANWYGSDEAKLDTIAIGDGPGGNGPGGNSSGGGETLDRSKIDQLVQDMAQYSAQYGIPSADTPLPPALQSAIDTAWDDNQP
ncbi:MAG: calcium-binding protein [Alphaproteobacteria bacterium]